MRLAYPNCAFNWTHCHCTGVCQIRLEIWPEPDLGKNGRISDLPSQNPVQP